SKRGARPDREPEASVLRAQLGAERAGRSALPPIVRPGGRAGRYVARVSPGVIPVRCPHPEPRAAPLEHAEGLPVERLRHAVRAETLRVLERRGAWLRVRDRKSTRLNSSHGSTSHAVFCLQKKTHR